MSPYPWPDGPYAPSHGLQANRCPLPGRRVYTPRRGQRLASALNAMLARLPLVTRQANVCIRREGAIAWELDPGAVHQQVQRAIGAPIRDLDNQGLLPPAQSRVIRHRPVKVRHLEQAGHHPGRLPQRQLEQNYDPLSGHCCAMPCRAAVRQNWIASVGKTVPRTVF